jgi:hypothetical protein
MPSKKIHYIPPETLGGVYDNIRFDVPLEYDDPRYVDTIPGRGKFSYTRLYRFYKVDPEKFVFIDDKPPERVYTFFCGHRGCGKSTELRKIASKLDNDNLFYIVFLDTSLELDNNNIQYVDVFMALANKLLKKLETDKININDIYLKNLESWFKEKILIQEETKEYSASIKSGIKAESGIPYLFSLFSTITAAFHDNATYKNELRRTIKNNFSQFALSFNQLLAAVNDQLPNVKKKSILFIIDGLDKLSAEDANTFFVGDVTQLQQIRSNFIYAGPIDLLCTGIQANQVFNCISLPMIKIEEKDGTINKEGYNVLKNMIYLRADKKLFTSENVVNLLIKYSGGIPRHVLQLLEYAYSVAKNDSFDEESIIEAAQILANTFKYFLTAEDYSLLYKIDHTDISEHVQSPQVRRLLKDLALLQYNDFWWKTHPVIRDLLPGYKNQAKQK